MSEPVLLSTRSASRLGSWHGGLEGRTVLSLAGGLKRNNVVVSPTR